MRSATARAVQRTISLRLGRRSEACVEATPELFVADDAPGIDVVQALLDGGDEARVAREAIELLGGEKDRGGLAILSHNERPTTFPKFPDFLGKVSLELPDRHDVFRDLEQDIRAVSRPIHRS
jgi:hypothetical protein